MNAFVAHSYTIDDDTCEKWGLMSIGKKMLIEQEVLKHRLTTCREVNDDARNQPKQWVLLTPSPVALKMSAA